VLTISRARRGARESERVFDGEREDRRKGGREEGVQGSGSAGARRRAEAGRGGPLWGLVCGSGREVGVTDGQ